MAQPGLLDLPAELCCRIAEQLEGPVDRIRLTATCWALRQASGRWFRNDVFYIDFDETEEIISPAELAWLCRVQCQVHVSFQDNLNILSMLTEGGARIVRARTPEGRLEEVPAALAGLTELRQLDLCGNGIDGGWESLPRQLLELDLSHCGLRQVPAALVGRGLQVVGI